MASSIDGDKAADAVVQICKDFINCESAGLADQTLHFHFKYIGLSDVSFAHGLTQALYTGSFLYADASTPSNFSAFCFFESSPVEALKMEEHSLLLHLIATQGQGKSLADIKALAKQTVKVPSSFDVLTNQLGFWVGAFQIFFGANSVSTMKMKKLTKNVQEREVRLKGKIALKEELATAFLFAVDQCCQMWLDECLSADDRLEVNDSNLFFNDIINKILLGEYNVDLLKTFNFNTRKNERHDKNEFDGAANKKKHKSETKKERISNKDQHPDFKMRAGESWKDT
eukprot:2441386-Ditylum_brightwellii.AAC.1